VTGIEDGGRAKLISDAAKLAQDAASQIERLNRKWRELLDPDDLDMCPADAIRAGQGIEDALRGIQDARQILAKRARLLDGPPPPLMLGATVEPGQLDIIARTSGADLLVGRAVRSGSGDDESWQLRLTDAGDGRRRGSIGLCYPASYEDIQEALERFVDENGPWWAPKPADGGTE
jgi:hypothetical protein